MARACEGSLRGARRRNNVGGSKGGIFREPRTSSSVIRLPVLNVLQLYPTCIARRSFTSRSNFLPFTLLRVPYDEYCRAEYDSVIEKTLFIREKL